MFVTDYSKIVVPRYAGRKPVVVSRGDPEEFAREVMAGDVVVLTAGEEEGNRGGGRAGEPD